MTPAGRASPCGRAVLDLPVAVRGGPRPVPVTWTVPRDPRGLVVLLHAFTRAPHDLDGFAAALAAAGLACARPRLSSFHRPYRMADAPFVTALALALASAVEDPGERLVIPAGPAGWASGPVLAGHSAGAATALHLAAVLEARGGPVRAHGLLLLDGADSLTRLAERALPDVAGVPLRLVAGRPTRCNRRGALTRQVAAARAGFLGVSVVGGGHGDVADAPVGRRGAAYRLACGDRTAPEDVALVRQLAVAWCVGLAAGQPDPAPGPGEPTLDRWVEDGRVALVRGSATGR